MQQRYYDPIIGRFYSNDPVGFSADKPMMFNRYAYANNNPYKFVDPDGLSPEPGEKAFGVGLAMASKNAEAVAAADAAVGNTDVALGVAAGQGLSGNAGSGQSLTASVVAGVVNRLGGESDTPDNGSIRNSEVGDTVRTPDNSNDFTKLKGSQGWKDSKTGDIVKTSKTNHSKDPKGEFKFGPKPNVAPTPNNKITVTRSDSKVYKKT